MRYTQYVPVNVPGAEVFIRLCFRNDDNTGRENVVEYTISNGKPVITYNGLSVSDASKLFGVLKYVVFVPEHLNLIKGAPELRRAYLDDVAVMQTEKALELQSRSETAQQYPGVRTQGYSGSGAFRAACSLGSGPCQRGNQRHIRQAAVFFVFAAACCGSIFPADGGGREAGNGVLQLYFQNYQYRFL